MEEGCIKQTLVSFIILLHLGTLGYTCTNRTKLCVEFRVQNSRWNHDILGVRENNSESGCLRQCARHPKCRAYNLWRNGTCEMVRGMGDCKETEGQERCIYVHLGECTGRVPWDVGRRNWSADVPCLTWQRHNAGTVCPTRALRSRNQSLSCAAVIPHKGLYLLGRYVKSRDFRTVSENTQPMWQCGDHGYIPRAAAGCPTAWQIYNVSDNLPNGAARLSSWTDGSPVYLVSVKVGPAARKIGYYVASRRKAFVLGVRKLLTPTSMFMLVYVWTNMEFVQQRYIPMYLVWRIEMRKGKGRCTYIHLAKYTAVCRGMSCCYILYGIYLPGRFFFIVPIQVFLQYQRSQHKATVSRS